MIKESNKNLLDWGIIDPLIEISLNEDFSKRGDITTQSIFCSKSTGKANLISRQSGIAAGLPIAKRVFHKIDSNLVFKFNCSDGERISIDQELGTIEGSVSNILKGERIALNFLQRLSGIASLTGQFVRAVEETDVKILDTRKTTPCFRHLEKYAVLMGGGINHRFGLYDMVLIKDNHIDALGGITLAVQKCVYWLKEKKIQVKIEVETRTLDEVREAVCLPIHRIMLDNMDLDAMKKAVEIVDGKFEIEASGNMTLDSVPFVAKTGVNFISVGLLTHSVRALDISLYIHINSNKV